MCQILFLLFSYNLVLPDVLVVVCWTESQDKLAKGTLFWVYLSVGKSLVVECVLPSLSLRWLYNFRALDWILS